MTGTAYGVGLGPGDPELMTLKADRLIRNAQVVAYPAPDTGVSFARNIAKEKIRPDAVEIPIVVPMVSDPFDASEIYDNAAVEVSRHLEDNRDVVVLCQGDPFFYGSFMYLFERLSSRFRVEIVPGVTSMTACASAAGLPLSRRSESISILPGTMGGADLELRLAHCEAAVIMKVGRHIGKIREVLDRLGLTPHSVFVSHASLPTQVVSPLADFEGSAPYFSTILVRRPDRSASN